MGQHDLQSMPALGEPQSDIEADPDELAEPEEDDLDRDAAEGRAAETLADRRHLHVAPVPDPVSGRVPVLQFAPPGFQVPRHIYKGTRHWSQDGKNIICPSGQYNYRPGNYSPAATHDDHLCDGCVKAARARHGVLDAASYEYGKP